MIFILDGFAIFTIQFFSSNPGLKTGLGLRYLKYILDMYRCELM